MDSVILIKELSQLIASFAGKSVSIMARVCRQWSHLVNHEGEFLYDTMAYTSRSLYKWSIDNGFSEIDPHSFDLAARNGLCSLAIDNLHIRPINSSMLVDPTIIGGSMKLLKWVGKNRVIKFSKYHLLTAIKHNRFKMVGWLAPKVNLARLMNSVVESRRRGRVPDSVLDRKIVNAVSATSLDILIDLQRYGLFRDRQFLFSTAFVGGNLDIFEYLLADNGSGFVMPNRMFLSRVDVRSVRWLISNHKTNPEFFPHCDCLIAVMNDDVKEVINLGNHIITHTIVRLCVLVGSERIVEYILTNNIRTPNTILDFMVKHNKPKMLGLIQRLKTDSCITDFLFAGDVFDFDVEFVAGLVEINSKIDYVNGWNKCPSCNLDVVRLLVNKGIIPPSVINDPSLVEDYDFLKWLISKGFVVQERTINNVLSLLSLRGVVNITRVFGFSPFDTTDLRRLHYPTNDHTIGKIKAINRHIMRDCFVLRGRWNSH